MLTGEICLGASWLHRYLHLIEKPPTRFMVPPTCYLTLRHSSLPSWPSQGLRMSISTTSIKDHKCPEVGMTEQMTTRKKSRCPQGDPMFGGCEHAKPGFWTINVVMRVSGQGCLKIQRSAPSILMMSGKSRPALQRPFFPCKPAHSSAKSRWLGTNRRVSR